MTKEKVIFVLLPEYADWEPALLAAGLRRGFGIWDKTFDVAIATPDGNPVSSIGGFRPAVDYAFDAVPDEFAALILVGGMGWFGPADRMIVPLAAKALERKAVVGGICNAALFLAMNGFLNNVDHTTNGLAETREKSGAAYTGGDRHRSEPSVRDGNMITANGMGFVEFARNVFTALNVAPQEKIDMIYGMAKRGSFGA